MPFTILIVDDEKLSRSYIHNMLREYTPAIEVIECTSAAEALQVLATASPDIVFLDIKMPGMDGFEMLEHAPHRDFELVFITAYNQYAIKALKEGAADYLLKPIKKEEFRQMLDKVSAKRRRVLESRSRATEIETRLDAYLADIRLKNATIEQLQEELEQLQQKGVMTNEKARLLDVLQKNVILTEDDWNNFKIIFESIYTNFFITLRERYASLTQAEVRLMALTRLNMTTKEMAAMLGISPETIRQTRWRLRKKMDLPDEVSIEDIVQEL